VTPAQVRPVSALPGPVGSSGSRLIVIRGNSGSGKSAVAAEIRANRPDGTVAIVSQDVIRRTILGTLDEYVGTPAGLVDLTARYALTRGFDVVVEGILNAKHYGGVLHRLAEDHAGVTHAYIYDLTFEETVRRHRTKVVSVEFGEPEMRKWWNGFQPIPTLREAPIGERETLGDTARRILEDCWGPPAT
jgi:hypothetical protein